MEIRLGIKTEQGIIDSTTIFDITVTTDEIVSKV
jgi:hypothetical protein